MTLFARARAERAGAPEPARAIPTAGGSTYSSNRGLT